jgi:hypothetical protein
MRRFLFTMSLVLSLSSASALAENYEVGVTRKDSNLYNVDGKTIYIHTRYCYEYVYYKSAYLRMDGYSGEIVFLDSGEECDVRSVYGPVEQDAGSYSVTVNREDDDWYEIWGHGIYIKTSACLSLALAEDAVLTLAAGGVGTMYVGGDECMVEGIYAKMML